MNEEGYTFVMPTCVAVILSDRIKKLLKRQTFHVNGSKE